MEDKDTRNTKYLREIEDKDTRNTRENGGSGYNKYKIPERKWTQEKPKYLRENGGQLKPLVDK